jgi:hypothetical protein
MKDEDLKRFKEVLIDASREVKHYKPRIRCDNETNNLEGVKINLKYHIEWLKEAENELKKIQNMNWFQRAIYKSKYAFVTHSFGYKY